MQRMQKVVLGIMVAVLVSAMGVGVYANHDEKKFDNSLTKSKRNWIRLKVGLKTHGV